MRQQLIDCCGGPEADRPALHEYDRVVSVLTGNRRRQSQHMFGLRAAGESRKTDGGYMVAFMAAISLSGTLEDSYMAEIDAALRIIFDLR